MIILMMLMLLVCGQCLYASEADFEAEAAKRSRVLVVQDRLQKEVECKQAWERELKAIEAGFFLLGQEKDAELRISACLELRRKMLEMQGQIQAATERQMAIAGNIDAVLSAGEVLPQTRQYMDEARATLRNLGLYQIATQKKLQDYVNRVKVSLQTLPPPDQFLDGNGMDFDLVKAGKASFYISARPVLDDGVSMEEAQRYIAAINARLGANYNLPTLAQAKLLAKIGKFPRTAIWTSAVWQEDKFTGEDMAERFGVKLYMIWDPQNLIGRGQSFGELPFAKFDKLNCYLAAPLEAGFMSRKKYIAGKLLREGK